MSKVSQRKWCVFIITLLVSIGLGFCIYFCPFIDIDGLAKKGDDFQYTVVSSASVLAGFMFSGVSIFISTLSNERMQDLFKHSYYDNLKRFSILGTVVDIVTILLSWTLICCKFPKEWDVIAVKFEIIMLVIGLIFFVGCALMVYRALSRLKGK